MTALVEVACPLCGADLYAKPEEAEQRHASVRQAITDARAALHGAPAPTEDEPILEF